MFDSDETKEVTIHMNISDLLAFYDRGILTSKQTRMMLQMSVMGWADSEDQND